MFNTAIKKLLLFATSMLIAVLIMEVVARAVIEPVPERLEVIRLSASLDSHRTRSTNGF